MTLWAFDIETAQWDRFLCGAAVSDAGETRVFRAASEVAAWYGSTGPRDVVLSHNGGSFDFLYLLDVVRMPWVATLSGSSIITERARGHAQCVDTYRLAPLSLDAWTETDASGAPREEQKTRQVLPCVCGESCPGYCAFAVDMPESDYRAVIAYCVSDCRILLSTYQEYVARLEAAGVAVRTSKGAVRKTIGGIAWATIERICDVGEAPDFETYDAELAAYYGGRVEVFGTRADAGHRYDVNSMYTWGLLQPVPAGVCAVIDRAPDALAAFARQRPGIYTARVVVPEGRFPLLPRRGADGSILWATGHHAGVWTEPELRAAVERGAKVDVLRARVWPETREVYRPWVELAYGIRERAAEKGDKSMRAYAKWLCNSATGKLAQGCETQSLYVRPSDEQLMRWVEMPDKQRNARIRAISTDVYVDTTRRAVPASARPIHAAYLISAARVKLLERLERAGDGALYCDTDAVYSRGADAHDVDDVRLGAWKYEGAMTGWEALAPKLYRYNDAEKFHVKAKGIPRIDGAKFEALKRGEAAPLDRGVETVRSAYRRTGDSAFVRKSSTRSLRADRRLAGVRYVLGDGSTVAPHRSASGAYSWPGVRDAPRELTPRLADGK